MEYIAVTLSIQGKDDNKRMEPKDLILPLDTPIYILVENLEELFGLPLANDHVRGFLSRENSNLHLGHTLREAGVKHGDFLDLLFENIKAGAFLTSGNSLKFDLTQDETSLGCHVDADIDLRSVPNQELVSKLHAKIVYDAGKYYVVDLGSMNGTYVNGRKIPSDKRALLETEATFCLGASNEQGVCLQLRIRQNE
jgi:hypothetical protein